MTMSSLFTDYPAILIIGKPGVGKSTLGNLLLGKNKFIVSDSTEPPIKECQMALAEINEQMFNVIDTPGIFDFDETNQEIIAQTITQHVHKIKAIILVIKATRFTDEQRETYDQVIKSLGKDSLKHMIVVFSKCKKAPTEDPNLLYNSLAREEKDFLNRIKNRFTILPNPDIFESGDQIVVHHMTKLKCHISEIPSFYTTTAFNKAWEDQKIELREIREREFREREIELRERELRERESQTPTQEIGHILVRIGQSLISRSGNRRCFATDSKVTLQNGEIKKISELAIGDYVFCGFENGTKTFSEVYLIIHADPNATTEFQLIDFVKQDGSQGKLRITPEHHIFVNNGKTDFAKNVIPNKTELFVSDGEKFISVTPTCITKEQRKGYYSPLTRSGTILVDEVLCSCYASVPPYQALINFAFMPLRIYTKFFPSNYLDKETHPYVKFLNMLKFSQMVSFSFIFSLTYTFIHYIIKI